MTREEQIRQYLKERNIPIKSLEANSIIEGAKWADKTMIDKVCELLAEMVIEVTYKDLNGDVSVEHYDKMEFIEDFRKAMEE